ncbi:hypothetical protein HaLaN_20482, partial [Haematococcus lacustris]
RANSCAGRGFPAASAHEDISIAVSGLAAAQPVTNPLCKHQLTNPKLAHSRFPVRTVRALRALCFVKSVSACGFRAGWLAAAVGRPKMGGKIKQSTKNFLKNKAKAGLEYRRKLVRHSTPSAASTASSSISEVSWKGARLSPWHVPGFAAKHGHVKEQPQHKAAADMGVDEFLDGGFQDLAAQGCRWSGGRSSGPGLQGRGCKAGGEGRRGLQGQRLRLCARQAAV